MRNKSINISSIETHLDEVIRKYVCKHCYAGTLPSTLSEKITEYVVIDCGNAINDLGVYGKGTVNIFLYAKPIANGAKSVAALSKLESKFHAVLDGDLFDTEHYSVPRELAYCRTDYDNTYNMHFTIKAIHLIIK